jgi:hypothetical protein
MAKNLFNWIRIPYLFAWFLAIVGWMFIFGGQHRLLYGPEAWGDYSEGNIVVLGNWMLLIGASLVFLYTAVSLGQPGPLWKYFVRIFVGGQMLFFADQSFARFEVWQIFQEEFWFICLILLGVLAFAWRLVYVKWWTYPAD